MPISYDGLQFEKLGHASVVVRTDDAVVYVDPWLPVLDTDHLDTADYVFVTHDDYDHYDPVAIQQVSDEDTRIVVYEAIDTSELPLETIPLPAHGDRGVGDVHLRAVPAYNRLDGPHVGQDGSPFHAEGEGIGLLLTVHDTTVYVTGDTDFLHEHADLDADVLVAPIGGSFTMDRHEAAEMVAAIEPDLVVPVHDNTLAEIPGVSSVDSNVNADGEAFKADVESSTDAEVELF
jgi:L-ascorbate metabolism protein UlaG (beta-lactamase superfamily)